MLLFIVSGREAGCMDNSPKKSKKVLILIGVIAFFAVVLGVFVLVSRNNKPLNKVDTENKKVLDKMKAFEVAPSGLNPSELTKVNALIIAGKDVEAKSILDRLKNSSGLQSYDKLNIYSSLSSVCSRLKDIECMKEVIVFNKDNKREDIYLIVQVAQFEKVNDPIASKQYYSQALKQINDLGGKSYVENLNKNSEVTLNYEEIINGSN
jgi:hypothetical protein